MSNVAEPGREHDIQERTFRELLDAFPAAVYTTDADGFVTFYNRAAEELAGRTPVLGEDKWCVTWKLYSADGAPLPLDQCPMAVTLMQGRAVRDVEVIAERPDGARVPLMPFPTPLRDASGKVTGAVNMLIDISAIKQAQANEARRADEQAALYRFTDNLYRAETPDAVYEAALDAILAALRCSRASILLFDNAGVMQFVASRGLSANYREAVAGHTPWRPGERDPQLIAIEDFAATDEPAALKETIRGEGLSALAFVPLVSDGGVIGKFMVYHDRPHAFGSEELDLALTIARQLGFAIERERARVFHRGAIEVGERLSAIVESSDDAIISKDLNGVIVSWNSGAERLFGYTAEQIVGRSVLTLIPPELQNEEPGIIDRIRRGERIEHYDTIRRHKSGAPIHISLSVSPVKDASGVIVGASKIARDVSERKRAEEQRSLLINELNHRVKNTLATVQSLAMQTLRNTGSPEEARQLFDARLTALSRAHDLLTAENWEGTSLTEVVDRALTPFRTEAGRIRNEGPHVRLSPKHALALSIALHELATNAAKYGALSGDHGNVQVHWTLQSTDDGNRLDLEWIERDGPAVEKPHRVGFGSRLIERNLARELGGTASIEFHPSGVIARISSPLKAPCAAEF